MIGAWPFLLLALAAWRTWYLLAYDSVFDSVRDRVAHGHPLRREFMECAYCFGFWVALVWAFAWSQWPEVTQWTALPLALSAALIVIDAGVDKLRGE